MRHTSALFCAFLYCTLISGSPLAAGGLTGFDCLIKPRSLTEVSTREEGVLARILVERGQFVERGQSLAELDSEVERATLALGQARMNMKAEIDEAQVNVDFAVRQLARAQDLFKKKAVSATDLDAAETDTRRARLQLEQVNQRKRIAELELFRAERQLEKRTVRSPVTGVVVERRLNEGELVNDRPIMSVASIDPLYVEIIAPVEHYGGISVGMEAQVLGRYPGAREKTAKVSVVDPVVDAASNTFGVRLNLPNPDRNIPGGVRCDIQFKP